MMKQVDVKSPVVIVDDSDTDVMIARICYQRSGLEAPLVTFESGRAFLAYLDQVGGEQAAMPAVVLLDINMPEMSGFEVLERTRERPQFQHMPIFVMLTNSDAQKDIDRAFELGANGFQVKPTDVKEYVSFFGGLLDGLASDADSAGV